MHTQIDNPTPIHGAELRLVSHLRELRQAAGWTQAELGRRAGVSMFSISRMEVGDGRGDRVATAIRIARALGVGLNHLYTIEGDE